MQHHFKRLIRRVCCVPLVLILCVSVAHASGFVVQRIQFKGLQGVPVASARSYLPIKVGQRLTSAQYGQIIRQLYATGFFSDVQLSRQGQTLIIKVAERPTLSRVQVVGNKKIPKKQLDKVLNQLQIAAGQTYDSSKVSSLISGLRAQYFSLGYYDARVTVTATPLPRRRVALLINVNEGSLARYLGISIIGNHFYSDWQLKKILPIHVAGGISFLSHGDKYSQQSMAKATQALQDFYLNHGFIKSQVLASQAAMSPARDGVYVTFAVTEGARYRVSRQDFSGTLLGKQKTLQQCLVSKRGQWFSKQDLLDSTKCMQAVYADQGYAFAQVIPTPVIDDVHHTVSVTYRVIPGQQIYVRFIHFSGNDQTNSMPLRNVMMIVNEGALYSQGAISESKRRLLGLPYLADVNVVKTPVPGKPNQIDLDYKVKERNAAQLSLQGGYSDVDGFTVSLGMSDPDFLGTGKSFGVQFKKSQYTQQYMMSYANPFVTAWGVSRSFSLSYSKYTPQDVNMATYKQNVFNASMGYSVPVTLYSSVNASLGYSHTQLGELKATPQEVKDFIHQYGDDYNQGIVGLGFSRETLNRAVFPTDGTSLSVSGTLNAPLDKNSLSYYSANTQADWFLPLYQSFVFHSQAKFSYGNGFGKTHQLPFFANYYAGGLSTVPGFSNNSLGPLDSTGNPIGANTLAIAQFKLIFPNGISATHLRTSIGFVAGNVFNNGIHANQIRASVGLFVTWLSPFAPINIGLSVPVIKKPGDDTSVFGFGFSTGL